MSCMTTVEVYGKGQNEKLCSQQYHPHQSVNDEEWLDERVVTTITYEVPQKFGHGKKWKIEDLKLILHF